MATARYKATPPTYADGDPVDILTDSAGRPVTASPTGSSSNTVQGTAAHDAAVVGNPVLMGGYASAAAPSDVSGDGDAVRAWFLRNGAQAFMNAYLQAGEDLAANRMLVEARCTGSGVLTTDTLVKTGAGFVHTITFSQTDAAPTAGTIDIYDNTSATGTKLFTWAPTTAVFSPFTITLDQSFATGLYVDFTTTADIGVSISFR